MREFVVSREARSTVLQSRGIARLAGVLAICGLSAGCFKPAEDLTKLDFTEMPFANTFVESDTAVMRAFDMDDLVCPDGEAARIYAVYDPEATGPVPGVLLLHSGAFDYVIEQDPTDILGGVHYRAESRLERPWALSKVWETVGMNPTLVDPSEDNLGALPSALVNKGAVVIIPANCWGDLWHGEVGDPALEGFERNGLTLAKLAYGALRDGAVAGAIGLDIPLEIDSASHHLVGLGSGGRGVAELANDPANETATLASVVIDSSPDLLSAYESDPTAWEDELMGFGVIYGEDAVADIDQHSVAAAVVEGLVPATTAVIWSSQDVNVPPDSVRFTASQMADPGFSLNTGELGSVFTNTDFELASDVVDWMVDGTVPGE